MLPSFEYFNNGHKLCIVGFVAGHNWDHLSREKNYRMTSAQIVDILTG